VKSKEVDMSDQNSFEQVLTSASLADALTQRRSVRGFTDQQIDKELLEHIFEKAQLSPSNCNTQPWKTYVASGEACDKLRKSLVEAAMSGAAPAAEFGYFGDFKKEYRQRQVDCAMALYDNMGIERKDKPARLGALLRNYEFFDAPHVAFIGMPKQFDIVNGLDVGIYLQTLMLIMNAHGIGSCAQGALAYYPEPVKAALNIPEEIGILVGLSFGYEDQQVPANKTRTPRADLLDAVSFSD
jgi:nitroreductase